MRLRSHLFLLVFLFLVGFGALPARAQSTPPASNPPAAPAPDPFGQGTNFVVTGGYASGSAQTNNGVQMTGILPLTSTLSLRADGILLYNPNVTISLIGPEYGRTAASLGKYFANSNSPVLQNLVVFGHVGAGEAFFNSPTAGQSTKAKFAIGVGGGLQINISSTMFIRPLDLSLIHSSIAGVGNKVIGNQAQFAASLGLSFR